MSRETERSRSLSRDEWATRFEEYITSRHCSLFGQAHSVASPEGKRRVAEEYADMVMRVSSGPLED
jgi:hypothetical protein